MDSKQALLESASEDQRRNPIPGSLVNHPSADSLTTLGRPKVRDARNRRSQRSISIECITRASPIKSKELSIGMFLPLNGVSDDLGGNDTVGDAIPSKAESEKTTRQFRD